MHIFSIILIVIVFANILYADRASKSINKLYHPNYSTVGNPNVSSKDDCALRAFTIEMAAYIAPASSKTNWLSILKRIVGYFLFR